MDLSTEQIEKLAKKYEKLGKRKCLACGSDDYGIERKIFALKPFSANFSTDTSGSYPVVTITCMKCGYAQFINAIAAGIIDRETGDFTKEWSTENGRKK